MEDEVRDVPTLASLPTGDQPGRGAACAISSHPEQGWSLLCNGVILFDGGRRAAARRAGDRLSNKSGA